MKKIIVISISVALALVGCNDLRDLYITSAPMIYAEGDWQPSLDKTDMTMDATAIAYGENGIFAKEYFYNPKSVTIPVDKGIYDVIIFNGLMYSNTDTHLDEVFFRSTNSMETFEAVVHETTPNKRLSRGDGEYIASNMMEIVTSAVKEQEITSSYAYNIKYKDGKNNFPAQGDYVEAELYMTPQAVSYESKITVTINTISSAYVANAALSGFVGSAFMASRMPSHFYVTHHFRLNNKVLIPDEVDKGTIESPVFVTFGPPVDVPDNKYEIYIKVTLVDGTDYEETVDVTDQVLPIIPVIQNNIDGVSPITHNITIPLEIEITLPEVEPVEGNIGIGDWDDDEIISVPIRP